MSESVNVNLPFFPGFYGSGLSQTLDYAEEREAEYCAEKESSKEYYPESYQPEELRLEASDYCDIFIDCMDYRAAHIAMAGDYVDSFDTWANENLGTPDGSFKFESMTSPREYNFETDRVFVDIPLSVMESIRAKVNPDDFAAAIKKRHTSYDGFISFYSNDVSDWVEKPLSEYDCNELATVLIAAMAPHVEGESEFESELCESIYENDHEYIDDHRDWKKFESKVQELRAEKLAQWIEADSEAAARYVAHCGDALEVLAIALADMDSDTRNQWEATAGIVAANYYRCPFTPDLFGESIH